MATNWVNTSTDSPSAVMVSTSSVTASSLPERPGHRAVLLEVLRRVVADLLEAGEQLEHQAAAAHAVGLLDLGHDLVDGGR